MFSLVSARYERASLIVTSNKPFSAWGEIFGDEVTAVAMIDRLVHHAEILSLKGDSYRLRDKDLGARPGAQPRRNRLTDHPRRPRRGPQNGSHAPVSPGNRPIEAPDARSRRRAALRLALRARLRAAQRLPEQPDPSSSGAQAVSAQRPLGPDSAVDQFSTGEGGPVFDRP